MKMKMKKILFIMLINLMFVGVTIRDGMAQAPDLDVSLVMDKTGYLFDPVIPANSDVIKIAITLENVGVNDIITSDGFSGEDYHLFLTFVSQFGDVVTASELLQVPVPIPEVINGVQVDRVETLSAGWILSTTLPNAYAYYDLLKSGNWSVTALISIRTYQDTLPGNPEFAELEPALFEGGLESNTVNFSLVADEDTDGYSFPIAMVPPASDPTYLADCDDRPFGEDGIEGSHDDGININPGMIEVCANKIDDDCNPATLDNELLGDEILSGGDITLLALIADSSVTSSDLKSELNDALPVHDTVLIAAINRYPQMNSSDLKDVLLNQTDVLLNQTPASKLTTCVLQNIVFRNPSMNTDDNRVVLIANTDLPPSILKHVCDEDTPLELYPDDWDTVVEANGGCPPEPE